VNKAQAQFIADKFLSKFKDKYTLVDEETLPILEGILVEYGKEFNKVAVGNLTKNGSIDTAKLIDLSLPVVYKDASGDYILEVGYPINSEQSKYYDYVNKGVQGIGGVGAKLKKNAGVYKFKYRRPSKSMVKAIKGWMERQSISAKLDDQTTKKSKLQKKRASIRKAMEATDDKHKLAYIFARAIKKNGIKATYYFDNAVKKVFNKEFISSLETALKNDVVLQIRSIYGNNNS
jgi:hypothetical protein